MTLSEQPMQLHPQCRDERKCNGPADLWTNCHAQGKGKEAGYGSVRSTDVLIAYLSFRAC